VAEIDIVAKFAGRIAEILISMGRCLAAGQVLARMDPKDPPAFLKKVRARLSRCHAPPW